MEKTVVSGNRASIGDKIVEKDVANFLEGIRFVHFIIIFSICSVSHGVGPELSCATMQKHGFGKWSAIVNRDGIRIVININVIKLIGNFGSVIKTSGSTIINGDEQFDFGVPGCSSGNHTKKDDQFVVRRGIVKITIEVTDVVIEKGFDVAVANFHG